MDLDDRLNKSPRLNEVHNRIISLSENVEYRIFPIYIRYVKSGEIFAVLYFKNREGLNLGLNLEKKPSKIFSSGKKMAYKEIKYQVSIDEQININSIFSSIKKSLDKV